MKRLFYLVLLVFIGGTLSVNAQVTVGDNTDPNATLDVVASSSATAVDGVIAPRVSIATLDTKEALYTPAQTGAIVYVDDITGGSTDTKTAAITAKGYYYFDGAVWKGFGGDGGVLKFNTNKIVEPTDATHPTGYTITGDEDVVITRWSMGRSVHFSALSPSKAGYVIWVLSDNTGGSSNVVTFDGIAQQNQTSAMARGRGYPTLWTGTQWLILTKQ